MKRLISSLESWVKAVRFSGATAGLLNGRYPRRKVLGLSMALLMLFLGAASQVRLRAATPGQWEYTGSLKAARFHHTATLLPDGMVLVTGGEQLRSPIASAELYNAATGTWSDTASLSTARDSHTATLLPNGRVLVSGGRATHPGDSLASAELYDPVTGTWSPTGSLNTGRSFHTATLLPNGLVLVAGGKLTDVSLASAELYNPATGTWSATGSFDEGRVFHTATLLSDGTVLVVGGRNSGNVKLASAELYDPATGSWSATGSLNTARYDHTATLLLNGKVLVAGGNPNELDSAELYDPATGTWSVTSSLNDGRADDVETLLLNGMVLVAGGSPFDPDTAELYDPASDTWSLTGSLNTPRKDHAATLLPDGRVLVTGGGDVGDVTIASAELYDSGTPTATPTPTPTVTPSVTPTVTPTPSATPTPSITPTPNPSATPTPTASGDALLNISTRARAETGDQVFIGGFILGSGTTKNIIVRALGPSLGARGVSSPLLDPSLQLFNFSGQLIASNNDWMTNTNQQEITDSGLAPTDPRESAILMSLAPGAYTAIVTGIDGTTNNIALVEVYDFDSVNTPQLQNISTRGTVSTGESVMIAGVIVGGTAGQDVVIRGLGPSLAASVPDALPDPQLVLVDGFGQTIATNDDWQDTQATDIANTGLAPTNTLESAILALLLPGAYTAILSDTTGATGVGLIEIYNISGTP